MRDDRSTVLVIDDHEGVRHALAVALESEFGVLTADGGPTGLPLLRRHRVDAVLLDLLLPDMPGLEVLSAIKAVHPSVPVIVVTALQGTATVVEAMRRGADNYLTKPWAHADLLAKIRGAVSRPRGASRCVILVGDDWESLAPVQVILELHAPVLTMRPAIATVRSAQEPWIAVLQAGVDPAPTVALIEFLFERYPGCPMLVATPDPAALRAAQLLVSEIVTRPYGVAEVVNRIGRLVTRRWGYPALPLRVGDHAARALEYLTRHYRAPVRLAEAAECVGLSVDRLAHVFRSEIGITMKQYSTRLRVTVGAHLLARTERKLEDIALDLGFDHASHFSRTFADVMKSRPGEYRRRIRGLVTARAAPFPG